jgi:hypothetical protein
VEHWEAKDQLEWYFQEAAGDGGMRSPFGYQLDRCEAGILFGGSAPKTDDSMVARLSGRADRCEIHARLYRVEPMHRAVLEAAYADAVKIGGAVSVALGCMTPEAMKYMRDSGTIESPRELMVKSDAVAKVKPDSESAKFISAVVGQAEEMLETSLDAYCAADPRDEVKAA